MGPMPSFMMPETFRSLKTSGSNLPEEAICWGQSGRHLSLSLGAVSALMVTGRAVYFVGIATAADVAGEDERNFEAPLGGFNLLKIAGSVGPPQHWPSALIPTA